MKRAIIAAAFGLLLTLAVCAPAPTAAQATPAAHDGVEQCVWQHELWSTVEELGSEMARWSVAVPQHEDAWGETYSSGRVEVSPRTPCEHVGDVVRHEWIHLQQQTYGQTVVAEHVDGHLNEIVADCGSELLGSGMTPYISERVKQRGFGCLPLEVLEAAALIEQAALPGVTTRTRLER